MKTFPVKSSKDLLTERTEHQTNRVDELFSEICQTDCGWGGSRHESCCVLAKHRMRHEMCETFLDGYKNYATLPTCHFISNPKCFGVST